MEKYWEISSTICDIINLGFLSVVIALFYSPYFMKNPADDLHGKKKNGKKQLPGAVYFSSMLILYFLPIHLQGAGANFISLCMVFGVSVFLERKNFFQKIYLAVTIYLLRWISGGLSLVIWSRLAPLTFMNPIFYEKKFTSLWLYV
ncbi:MAG: hypothetical protein IJ733_02030 [Lachnospiraceae bacterium]|nr:hypothetical protein [Lachnospiraceae bacterium]